MALPEETRESIRGVSPSDLLRSGLELMCRSIVLIEHGIQGRDCRAEDVSAWSISWSRPLRGERELAQQDAAETRQHLAEEKVEALRAATEIVELKKMLEERDEKLSSSATEMVDLRAAMDEAEAELDQNYEDSKGLLKQ